MKMEKFFAWIPAIRVPAIRVPAIRVPAVRVRAPSAPPSAHDSRPPAGPSTPVGPGPPPVPPRRPQSSLAPPLRRLWSSAIASMACSAYPRPRLVLHQREATRKRLGCASAPPAPALAGAAAPGAPPAPSRCQPRPAARCQPRPAARCQPRPAARCQLLHQPRPAAGLVSMYPRRTLRAPWVAARRHPPRDAACRGPRRVPRPAIRLGPSRGPSSCAARCR